MKKLFELKVVTLITLFVVILISCGKDKTEPINLFYIISDMVMVENNSIQIYYDPISPQTLDLKITGGDGKYTISNSNSDAVKFKHNGDLIEFTGVSLGSSMATIKDRSGNVYTLNISVFYPYDDHLVLKREVLIEGEDLTDIEKQEINAKLSSSFPVQIDGGYRFIFNYTEGDMNRCRVLIYKDKHGLDAVESTFHIKEHGSLGTAQYYTTYNIMIDGQEREFRRNNYVEGNRVYTMFEEIFTDGLKVAYPNLKRATTRQVTLYR